MSFKTLKRYQVNLKQIPGLKLRLPVKSRYFI